MSKKTTSLEMRIMFIEKKIDDLIVAINGLAAKFEHIGQATASVTPEDVPAQESPQKSPPKKAPAKKAEPKAESKEEVAQESDDFSDFEELTSAPEEDYTADELRVALKWVVKQGAATEAEGKNKAVEILKSNGSTKATVVDLPQENYVAVMKACKELGFEG